MSLVHEQMKLAVRADIAVLWRRLPRPEILRNQLREMINAERRAAVYDIKVPWREGQWYGIDVPETLQEVDNSTTMSTRTTGKRAGRQKENKK